MSHILHISGGSAGHLAPLVAVAEKVYELNPNTLQSVVCSDASGDAEFLTHAGFDPTVFPRPRINIFAPIALWKVYRKSRHQFRLTKPNVIFSKGGLISVPACYAAHRLKIPIVMHESDAVMGKANKLIAHWADKICMGLTPEKDVSTNKKIVITGNPVRPGITKGSKERGLKLTKLSGKKPILLVIGGSQGAETLNTFVRGHIEELTNIVDIIHITGKGKMGAGKRAGYWSTEIAYEELPDLYACTTMVLSRAGAGSISECAANKLPMILVPIKGLAHDHQVRNAETAASKGGAIMVNQDDMNSSILSSVQKLATNKEAYKTMQQKVVTLQDSEATGRIAKILLETIAKSA